jgi:BirA family transcriptional regulator, biotin operon repressor / biotin---[acetyl-CoA-carboxylase] ligase
MSKLDVAGVQRPLTDLAKANLERLDVFSSIASTNTYLMTQPPPSAGRYRVAIADHQTSGRGRHNRHWISAPGSGVYLSIAYTFPSLAEQLDGLTLAIGVGVIAALQRLDIGGLTLKWPNDIVALDGKLGGILTEIQSGKAADVTVVTGVGLNLNFEQNFDFGTESGWAHRAVDLKSIKPDLPDRELIAGTLVDDLFLTFKRFEGSGLAGFMDDWREHDWLQGREITVDLPGKQVTGIAAGIGDDGTLLVETKGGQVRVLSGSIIMAGPREAAN